MLRVRRVLALDGFRVRLTLTSGDVVERDLTDVLWGPVFEPLRADLARFREVSVEAGTLVWAGGADLDPDVLIWGGPAPHGSDVRPPRYLKLESPRSAPMTAG